MNTSKVILLSILISILAISQIESRIFMIPRKWFREGEHPITTTAAPTTSVPKWENFKEGKY